MRFVIYGAGGIGGVIGARLHQSGHDVVLKRLPPPLTYADTAWTGLADGTAIPDADPIATGNQPATIGTSAFASINACCFDAIRSANGSNRMLQVSPRPIVKNPLSRSKVRPARVPLSMVICSFILQ